jgi:hypothetical protein
MTDIVKRLRADVFYGDERMARMGEHNPLHMEAADEIERLRALPAPSEWRGDAASVIEQVLFRRLVAQRLEGYTMETAWEILAALAPPGKEKEGG